MSSHFAKIAFTDAVKEQQQKQGSRRQYARMEQAAEPARLGPFEKQFLESRDHFFIATVSETGWPYVQHRGGPAGFVQVLDPQTIAFPDYPGNRQYITAGNLAGNDRVALIFMDYPNQERLKILGRAEVREGAFVIRVEAFDWNCQQHITPRYTLAELEVK